MLDKFKKKNFDKDVTNSVSSQVDDEVSAGLKKISRIGYGILALIFLAIVLFGSHFTLTEEQQAVVTTFGSPTVVTKSGWNWKIPMIQKVRKVPKSIIGMPIGYNQETNESILRESLMITSDFNFVNVDFWIDYKISDPIKAVTNSDSYEEIIKNLAQSYIRDTVGVHTVDDIMTTGKTTIESEIQEKLMNRMIEEDIGFSIEKVTLQDVELPTYEVQNAFNEVENAKQGMDTKINEANKYRNEQIPKVEAQIDTILKEAEAYKEERINEAKGQVARFESMYEEYQKYPLITKRRMFYETMEEILPSMKVIIDGSDGTQTMLPLESFSTTTINSSTETQSTAN